MVELRFNTIIEHAFPEVRYSINRELKNMVNLSVFSLLAVSSSIVKAASSSASATSSSSCNPIKATGCSPDPALGTSFAEDFKKKSEWFPYQSGGGNITYGSDGLSMTLNKRYDNPALKSDFYIMYGKVEVELKAGPDTGVVSSFYLQSDDLDELDIEWIGSDNTQFQSNYFSKGNTSTYNRGAFHSVDSPVDKFHNYTLDWGMDKTTWALDGNVVRTLDNTSSEGYPQTPMFIKMGIWAGGDPSNAAGTIEWAGGDIDYSQAPFTMQIKRVVVTDYSTGKEYSYSDQSGSWESIEAKDGSVNGRKDQADKDYDTLMDGGEISNTTSSSSSSTKSSTSSTKSLSSSTSSSKASSQSTKSSTISSSQSASATDSKTTTSTSHTGTANGKEASASESSVTSFSSSSTSRTTLSSTSQTSQDTNEKSQSTSRAAAGSSGSGSSAISSTAVTSGSLSGSASTGSSSTNEVQTASNAAAAVGLSQNSLPFFAAVLALLF